MKSSRMLVITLLLTLFLGACNGVTENTNSELTQQIQSLSEENERLKEQIGDNQNSKGGDTALRETLNHTFKIINAMEKDDYDFIASVSSPNITINQENKSITIDNREQNFLKGINFSNLEYRFYELKDQRLILGIAIVGNEQNIEIVFEYIKGDENQWLYNGHIT
ncbi:hypothetical protein [Paenibacillus jiagnxiensis]|uniref:hypothetical protein n=1 Tax=Paenibacillus jiagnxiensis TaxID=3228926 RepID=UPI0033A9B658